VFDVVVTAALRLTRWLSLIVFGVGWRLGGTGELSVELLFPKVRGGLLLLPSSWPWVLGIDAVGGAPHRDFADESCARMTAWGCPGWRGVSLAGVIVDLVREVGDQLESLG
jgi:hypothetical protein